jgi:cysteine synthase
LTNAHSIMTVHRTILETIGQTPLVRLRRLLPRKPGRVFLKLEGSNPTGSIKDRTCLRMVKGAIERGELRRGGTIVEATSGNVGKSLALIGAAYGINVMLVVDPKIAPATRRFCEALGATIVLVDRQDEDGGYQKTRLARVKELAELLSNVVDEWLNQAAA